MPKTAFLQANTAQYGWPYYVPVAGAPSGNVWYVSSVYGTASGPGRTPEEAFNTLALGVSAAVASNNDLIVVGAGHTETLTSAGAVDVSKVGLRVFGEGFGRARPVFNYGSSTAASFNVTAANNVIQNVVFRPLGVDAVVAAVNVSAADVRFSNCEWELADGTGQAVLGLLTTSAASRLVVEDCFFHGTADAGTTAAVCLVGGDGVRILRNVMQGAYSSGVGAIQQITTTTTNCIVLDNVIQNYTAVSTKAMVFTASSTGQIARNHMQILSGSAPITGAAMSWAGGNTYAAALATAATAL